MNITVSEGIVLQLFDDFTLITRHLELKGGKGGMESKALYRRPPKPIEFVWDILGSSRETVSLFYMPYLQPSLPYMR